MLSLPSATRKLLLKTGIQCIDGKPLVHTGTVNKTSEQERNIRNVKNFAWKEIFKCKK